MHIWAKQACKRSHKTALAISFLQVTELQIHFGIWKLSKEFIVSKCLSLRYLKTTYRHLCFRMQFEFDLAVIEVKIRFCFALSTKLHPSREYNSLGYSSKGKTAPGELSELSQTVVVE